MLGITNSKLNNYQEGYDAGYSSGKTVGANSVFKELEISYPPTASLPRLGKVPYRPLSEAQLNADISKYPLYEDNIHIDDILIRSITIPAAANGSGRVLIERVVGSAATPNSSTKTISLDIYDLGKRCCILDAITNFYNAESTSYVDSELSVVSNYLFRKCIASSSWTRNVTVTYYLYSTTELWVVAHAYSNRDALEEFASDVSASIRSQECLKAYYYNTSGILTPALR